MFSEDVRFCEKMKEISQAEATWNCFYFQNTSEYATRQFQDLLAAYTYLMKGNSSASILLKTDNYTGSLLERANSCKEKCL